MVGDARCVWKVPAGALAVALSSLPRVGGSPWVPARATGQPPVHAAPVLGVARAKSAAQVRFFVSDDEDVRGAQRSECQESDRRGSDPEPDAGKQRSASEVHGIAYPAVRPNCHERARCVEWSGGALAMGGEQHDAPQRERAASHDQGDAYRADPLRERTAEKIVERPYEHGEPGPHQHEAAGVQGGAEGEESVQRYRATAMHAAASTSKTAMI